MSILSNYLKKNASAAIIPSVFIVLLVTMMARAQTTQPEPVAFPHCTSDIFTAVSEGSQLAPAQVTLQRVKLDTPQILELDPVGAPMLDAHYNAMGYNPQDDFLYAVKSHIGAYGELLKIGQNGAFEELGKLDGFDFRPVAAEFDEEGHMYVADDTDIYKYEFDGPGLPKFVSKQPLPKEANFVRGVADIGLYNGFLWGIYTEADPGGASTNYKIVKINPETLDSVLSVQFQTLDGSAEFTSVFAATNGIYAYDTKGGSFVKMLNMQSGDPNLITLEKLAVGRTFSGSDGAKCQTSPLGLPAEIAVTKTSEQSAIIPAYNLYTEG